MAAPASNLGLFEAFVVDMVVSQRGVIRRLLSKVFEMRPPPSPRRDQREHPWGRHWRATIRE